LVPTRTAAAGRLDPALDVVRESFMVGAAEAICRRRRPCNLGARVDRQA
jgi:hypothetical protein